MDPGSLRSEVSILNDPGGVKEMPGRGEVSAGFYRKKDGFLVLPIEPALLLAPRFSFKTGGGKKLNRLTGGKRMIIKKSNLAWIQRFICPSSFQWNVQVFKSNTSVMKERISNGESVDSFGSLNCPFAAAEMER
jgi:hypothetical protein